MTISSAIKSLVNYAEKEGLIAAFDKKWAINRILEALELDGIVAEDAVFEDAYL